MINTRNVILKARIENVITELMLKTSVNNVWLDETTTLAAKLAEIYAAIDEKADQSDISAAIGELISGAPETYDTLKEIADYISSHEDIVVALNQAIGKKVDKIDGKGLSANDFTNILKTKLDGIAANAEVNQNAFSKVTIGTTSIAANEKTDNLTLIAGNNITLIPDAANKKLTIATTDAPPSVIISNSQPVGMKAGDLWIDIWQ